MRRWLRRTRDFIACLGGQRLKGLPRKFFLPLLIIALILPSFVVTKSDSSSVHNVRDYGAAGDGKTDDTNAFMEAWNATCTSSSSSPPIMEVPADGMFLIHPVLFSGPCKSSIINVEIKGEIVAPENPSKWKCCDENWMKWIHFKHVHGLRLYGGGRIHGRGDKWWNIHSLKKPAALQISNSEDVQLINLNLKDNPRMHIILNHLRSVFVLRIKIDATNATIVDSNKSDDCICIVDGCADVKVNNILCGPGNGKDGANHKVENVYVGDIVFTKSTNGARIKSWQGGRGYARNITFERICSHEAANPIIIDQFYCDHRNSKGELLIDCNIGPMISHASKHLALYNHKLLKSYLLAIVMGALMNNCPLHAYEGILK
ncbi:probable polygalacturonase At3g15720 [Coffea arabica]|uniref:Probable polygalacturonase At3g15720 n=1 Tax=Coffea arabica TaxID=13443 RepID=A0ABM4W8Z5_COFAR